jgi:hypothetical protein
VVALFIHRARAPADALGVKQVLEKALTQDGK